MVPRVGLELDLAMPVPIEQVRACERGDHHWHQSSLTLLLTSGVVLGCCWCGITKRTSSRASQNDPAAACRLFADNQTKAKAETGA